MVVPPLAALDALQSLILGLVEGLTEYLPVSSTGHLIIADHFLGIQGEGSKAFDVVIQIGAILAVLGLYRRRVGQMALGLVGRDREGGNLLLNLAIAFMPAAVIGLMIEKRIKALFDVRHVAWALLVGGVLMIAADLLLRRRREQRGLPLERLGPQGALVIGLFQVLAMWPGTSRSLVTIIGGLIVGLTPLAAAEFSFLLALPTLSAAALYEVVFHHAEMAGAVGAGPLIVGLLAAAVSAAFAVKGFVAWLVRHGFVPFGAYRIVAAAVVFLFVL
ncbi:MAG: undecaprenyl-diphosphate phosphatase [Candidatus Polarisedimenticolia bacterium]